MKEVTLYDLISCLEYGTNLHISVTFFGNFGNRLTVLPEEKKIHSKPICDRFKSGKNGTRRCIRCRETAIKRMIKTKEPFGGFCVNGVFEYCVPVIIDKKMACAVFIGNILKKGSALYGSIENDLLSTLEADFEKYEQIGGILKNYIEILLKDGIHKTDSPLIENVKAYLLENITYDFTVKEIASVFNYNEKYLGKLFLQKTGLSVKQYINKKRINLAEDLLKNSDLSVTSISAKVGFNNVTYFNKIFKSYLKISPKEYRKR